MNVFGQDMRGTPEHPAGRRALCPTSCGALIIAGLVEVEKVADGDAEGYGNEAERGGARGAMVAVACRDRLRPEGRRPRRVRPWPPEAAASAAAENA